MPDALPVPRDREEREKMVAAWTAGAGRGMDAARGAGPVWRGTNTEAPAAIPSPAGEAVPELAYPWAIIDGYGHIALHGFESKDDARMHLDPYHRIVRLAIAEVVEPEPEAAPSGRRYRVWANGNGVRIEDDTCLAIHDCGPAVECIPLEDVAYVARLLEASR